MQFSFFCALLKQTITNRTTHKVKVKCIPVMSAKKFCYKPQHFINIFEKMFLFLRFCSAAMDKPEKTC